MFREFWEEKKHLIQFVGILTTIGALFLNVKPIAENEQALKSLLNIQFIWLLIISVSVTVLLFNLLIFFIRLEGNIKTKYKLDFELSIVIIFIYIAGYILFNFWRYILAIYNNQFSEFLSSISYSISTILTVLSFYVTEKITEKLKIKFLSFKGIIIFSIIITIFLSLKLKFIDNFSNIWLWILIIFCGSIVLIKIIIPIILKFNQKFKKNIINDSN